MTDQVQPEGEALPSDANASPVVETQVEAKGSEADSSPAAADPGEKKPEPVKDGRELRISELTRRLREAERRNERLLRIAEESRQQPAPQPRPQPQADKPKTLKDFNFDEAAYTEYKVNELAETAAAKAAAQLQQREAAERRAKLDEAIDKFAATVEDYSEVVTDTTPVSENMAKAIEDSDIPGELLYYFGKNPEVALKLYRLPLTKAAREIGRIEDRLIEARKKAAEKPVSQAPPPAPKIDAKTASERISTTSPDSDKLSDDEWVKAEAARLRRKAQRKSD